MDGSGAMAHTDSTLYRGFQSIRESLGCYAETQSVHDCQGETERPWTAATDRHVMHKVRHATCHDTWFE